MPRIEFDTEPVVCPDPSAHRNDRYADVRKHLEAAVDAMNTAERRIMFDASGDSVVHCGCDEPRKWRWVWFTWPVRNPDDPGGTTDWRFIYDRMRVELEWMRAERENYDWSGADAERYEICLHVKGSDCVDYETGADSELMRVRLQEELAKVVEAGGRVWTFSMRRVDTPDAIDV